MGIKVPDVAEKTFLDLIIKPYFNTNSVLRLYVNSLTPLDATVVGDFTEASFPGYLAQNIMDWGVSVTTPEGRAQIEAGVKTFTRGVGGSPQTVYGYYVTGVGGSLLFAEKVDPPVTLSTSGQQYTVLPRFTVRSEF
jgi:hypothetical protein